MLVSFMRPVMKNPCSTTGTGRLVIKNLKGERRPLLVNAAIADRMLDTALSSLHSSNASITTRQGGNSWSRVTALKGSTINFSNCLDANADDRSGSLHIAL